MRSNARLLPNRALAAEEARDLGLVSDVFPELEFQARALELAQRLAAGPTQAYARAKHLVGLGETLETQMESERRAVAECGRTEDFRAGVQGFLDKHAVAYAGR